MGGAHPKRLLKFNTMTTQQQTIINSLITEFEKINNKPTYNGFMRIGEAVDKLNEWEEKVRVAEVNNDRMEIVKRNRMDDDLEKIREELRLSGLNVCAENENDNYYGIVIYPSGKYYADDKIKISYEFSKTRDHNPATNQSFSTYTGIVLESFQAKGSWYTKFETIEDLFQDSVFHNAFQNIIRISKK